MPFSPQEAKLNDQDPGGSPMFGVDIPKLQAQIINLHRRLNQSEVNVLELQAKLKETIRAVERLAKGKSLGALGLPTEESWNQPN